MGVSARGLRATPTGRAMGNLGRLVAHNAQGARTDQGIDGEISFYASGGSIFLQMWSDALGAWKTVELT